MPGEVKLDRCQICRGPADIGYWYTPYDMTADYHYIKCPKCKVKVMAKNKEVVIAVWNRRTPEPKECGGDNCDMTAAYMLGFEKGKEAAKPEPGTSVVRWVEYDGTVNTLPPWNTELLIAGIDGATVGCYVRTPDDQYWVSSEGERQPVEEGDRWAYLPEPPEVISDVDA